MSLQSNQTFHSTGFTKPESTAPNQLPTVAVHRVDNTNGPGHMSKTSAVFGHWSSSRRLMAATIRVGVRRHSGGSQRAMRSRAAFLPSQVDTISSREVKFDRRRWFRLPLVQRARMSIGGPPRKELANGTLPWTTMLWQGDSRLLRRL